MRLRLSQKGLMLVSAVLLLELVLIAAFAGMLGRSDQELDHSYLSVSVTHHVDNLRKTINDAEYEAGLPITNPAFHQTLEYVSHEFNALRLLLKEDNDCLILLDEAESEVSHEMDRLETARQRHSGSQAPTFDYEKTIAFSGKFSELMERLTSKYRRPLEFVTDRVTRSRRLAKSNIIFAVLINTVLAVATTLFFMQSIVNRLSTVAENSRRWGRGDDMEPPLEGADEIAALDKVLHDSVNRRKEVENLLKESEARTRSLIENMPLGVITIDEDGKVESINPETEKIFGYNFEELRGDLLSGLFTESDLGTPQNFVEIVFQKTRERPAKFKSLRKNGELFPVELTLTEYNSIDGKRYLAIIQDITERQRAEQFRQELISMVSHDLRSPLTSVQGVMTLLARGMYGQLTETGEKRVQVAEHSLGRLIHLVDDILDLERMEAGKLQVNPQPVPISSIIDRSIESVYDYAMQQHVTMETTAEDCEVFVDEDRIVQVVVNLLSNAIKFSPRNSKIELSSQETEDWVELRVSDQGPGIPLHHQENIFERFQQVDSANIHKGTGLGLTIAKAIVDGHEGLIGVKSEPGSGSTFWFRIPKRPAAQTDVPQALEHSKPSGVTI